MRDQISFINAFDLALLMRLLSTDIISRTYNIETYPIEMIDGSRNKR